LLARSRSGRRREPVLLPRRELVADVVARLEEAEDGAATWRNAAVRENLDPALRYAVLDRVPPCLGLRAAIVVVDIDRLAGREGALQQRVDAGVEEDEPRGPAQTVGVEELHE